MAAVRCGVDGCVAPVRWVLKNQQADGDLHSCLCQEHWNELHRHAWVIAMTGYDIVTSADAVVTEQSRTLDPRL